MTGVLSNSVGLLKLLCTIYSRMKGPSLAHDAMELHRADPQHARL